MSPWCRLWFVPESQVQKYCRECQPYMRKKRRPTLAENMQELRRAGVDPTLSFKLGQIAALLSNIGEDWAVGFARAHGRDRPEQMQVAYDHMVARYLEFGGDQDMLVLDDDARQFLAAISGAQ